MKLSFHNVTIAVDNMFALRKFPVEKTPTGYGTICAIVSPSFEQFIFLGC